MCRINTVNGTLGMEWRVGNELTGSEFYLGYINFARSLWVQHPRPLSPIQNRGKE